MEIFQDERVFFRISNYGKISKCKTFRKRTERLKVNYITEEIRWQDCAKQSV